MPQFTQQVIWITGASSGIGEALAYAFSAAGARLILSSRRQEELERVRQACAHPDQTAVLPLDLVDIPALAAAAGTAIARFGQIDILIHNGGISQRSLAIDTPLEIHRRVMELDYFSYVELTRLLLPHFTQRRSGQIVVVSSVMGKIGTPMRSAYAAAKHALHGYFDCLRAELAGSGVHVTVLTPGYIRTNIALHAITADGSSLGQTGHNIANGLPADKAARQIIRAIARKRQEVFIGKFGMEKIALWLNRMVPGVVRKLTPKFVPK